MHAMLSNDYKRKLCCMAAGAPAAFQSENARVRPPIIDVFHVRSSNTARHTKCNSRQTRRGSASPQSAHTSSYHYYQKISKGPGGACVRRRAQWHNGQSKPAQSVPTEDPINRPICHGTCQMRPRDPRLGVGPAVTYHHCALLGDAAHIRHCISRPARQSMLFKPVSHRSYSR